jgi:hypothetical protein
MTGQLITFPIRLYVRGARLLFHVAEDVTGKAMMSTLRVAGALGNLRPGASDGGAVPAQATPASDDGRSSEATRRSRPARGAGSRTASPRRRGSGASPPNGDRSSADRPASRRPARPARPEPKPASTPPADLPEPDPRIAERAERDSPPAEPAPPPAGPTGGEESVPLASERLEQEGMTASVDLDAPAAADHVSAEVVLVREDAEPGAEDGAGAEISVQEPWDGYGRMNAEEIIARLASCTPAELATVALFEGMHRNRPTIITAAESELAKPQG